MTEGKSSLAFSASSLLGGKPHQEDAFYVDPQRGSLLLVDACSVTGEKGAELARGTVASFLQSRKKRQALGDWLQEWNRSVWADMKKRRVEERATASLFVASLRGDHLWECLSLGSIAAWQLEHGSCNPLTSRDFGFPLTSLGACEVAEPQRGGFLLKSGHWILAASGAMSVFSLEEAEQIRGFLAQEDFRQPSFRDSSARYLQGKLALSEGNTSLLWLGKVP